MGWLVGGVWIGVGVAALVVLVFCLYELRWKSRRLQRDLDELGTLRLRIDVVREELATVQQRLADSRAARTEA